MKNILDYLEKSAAKYSEKYIFRDENNSITYADFVEQSKRVGTALLKNGGYKKPIAILIDRGINCLIGMFGALYCGGFYVVIDSSMPIERIKTTLSIISTPVILTEKSLYGKVAEIGGNYSISIIENLVKSEINSVSLNDVRKAAISTDPMYILFTSGTSGVPKGAVLTHQNVIDYTKWFIKAFDITSDTVFGNQTPFFFSMSVSDIFSTVMSGATLNIIPKIMFTFPIKLIGYLNERIVNTIYWVPSALSIVANTNLFKYAMPKSITKVLFAGEIMPTKQLNYWIKYLPNAKYANLFGPTEITDICTYYVLDRTFADDEAIPIGRPCDNLDVFLINEKGEATVDSEEGEMYVRGSFVALGYYNNSEKTSASFVQNPLNENYPEIVYKTGDICRRNKYGEFEFISRKDFQIKHLGYRIELGEIENATTSIDSVNNCLCLYNNLKDSIALIYEGGISEVELSQKIALKLPVYMCPNKIVKIKQIQYNQNGKVDRAYYKKEFGI